MLDRMQMCLHTGTQLITKAQPEFPQLARAYEAEMSREVRRPSGQGMFKFNADDLRVSGVNTYLLATVVPGDQLQLVAGLHVAQQDTGMAVFKGALTVECMRGRGFMSSLIPIARLIESVVRPKLKHETAIRIYTDGTANTPSERAFIGAGFAFDRVVDYRICDNERDQHLRKSANPEGLIQAKVLQAGPLRVVALEATP